MPLPVRVRPPTEAESAAYETGAHAPYTEGTLAAVVEMTEGGAALAWVASTGWVTVPLLLPPSLLELVRLDREAAKAVG